MSGVSRVRKRQVDRALVAIDELDLAMVKRKLMDPEEGMGWTETEVDVAEVLYKQFLKLNVRFPEKAIVPTKTIDTFWHQHILDTRAYACDCEQIFGFFFHHFPYFGMRGEEDAKNLRNAFTETCELFKQEFGVDFEKEATLVVAAGCKRCRSCGSTSSCSNPRHIKAADCSSACSKESASCTASSCS